YNTCKQLNHLAGSYRHICNVMCNRCVFTPFPDRGNSCLDTGSFFLNFKACCSCQKRTLIETCNKESKEEEDQTEVIKYQRKSAVPEKIKLS
ncbi:Protein Churchill, partial [Trichoplax sp. H2]